MILVIAEQRERQAESRDAGKRSRRAAAGGCAHGDRRSPCVGAGRRASAASAAGARARRRSKEVVTRRARRRSSRTRPTASPRRCRHAIGAAVAVARAAAAHLPDARLRAEARRAASTARSSPTSPASRRSAASRRSSRPMFQGKLTADVVPQGPAPHFVTFQIGAYPRRSGREGIGAGAGARARASRSTRRRSARSPRRRSSRRKQAVDLSQAERIVVGRPRHQGAGEHRRSPQQLAEALGAEIAASRPICDAGWLPMERQVGSSGPDRRAEAVPRARHLRRHSAPGRHEGLEHRSSRSTRIPTRRSSRSPTTASSATCSRSCRR